MVSSSAQACSRLKSPLLVNGAAIPIQQAHNTSGSLQLSMYPCLPRSHTGPYSVTKAYDAKLRTMKNGALFVAGLQKTSRFFGICALTWATVVLLGGFASSLKSLDFYLVSILLLLEAARLSTTQVFSKLLSKTLFREHQRPEEFQHEDLQYYWASRLDLVGQGSSCLVAIVGLSFVVVRFHIHRQHSLTGRDEFDPSNINLPPALYTFYVLVILISVPAIASGVCRPFLRWNTDDSLMCYHDEVYNTAMEMGMPEADDLNYLDFAFKKLARDHMRNIRPRTIQAHNRDLINFMYHNENGVEVTCEYLRSGDVSKQQVAANLPGFWRDEDRIEKQVALFWALRDRLYGAGKVAEGAANSLSSLAISWEKKQFKQHPFLINDPSKVSSANVVDTLVDLVVQSMRPSLLFQLRALQGCCTHQKVLQHIYSQGKQQGEDLCRKLQAIIEGNQTTELEELSRPEKLCSRLKSLLEVSVRAVGRERTKVYAGSTLHSLLCFGGVLSAEAKKSFASLVDEIHPARNPAAASDNDKGPTGHQQAESYILDTEKAMLDDLRQNLGLPPYQHWGSLQTRDSFVKTSKRQV